MKQVIFLDFDGVVVDSLAIAIEIFQDQYPDMSAELLQKWFKGNVIEALEQHNISVNDFFAEYAKQLPRILPVAGMPSVLANLAETYSLQIVSSTKSSIVENYLTTHGLREYIHSVLGSDVASKKTDKFKKLAEEHNIALSDCIFITDTVGDLAEARSLGIHTIAVTWGYHSKKDLLQDSPDALVENPTRLEEAIKALRQK